MSNSIVFKLQARIEELEEELESERSARAKVCFFLLLFYIFNFSLKYFLCEFQFLLLKLVNLIHNALFFFNLWFFSHTVKVHLLVSTKTIHLCVLEIVV